MTGQDDIEATEESVASDTQITCDLDLTGVETGDWDVVVTNDDGQYCTLAAGFSVEYPAPTVTSITPEAGTSDGAGHSTDLTGDGFFEGGPRSSSPARICRTLRQKTWSWTRAAPI